MLFKWVFILSSLGILFPRSPDHFDPNNLYQECNRAAHSPLPPSIAASLDQPFTYLGEGAQIYAFVSKDGTLVLKLFKARHQSPFKLSRFLDHLMRSQTDWEVSHNKWRWKFKETNRRYELAFTHLKDETGLIYLHFAPTHEKLPVTLVDKYTYEVELSSLPFLLQKRVELAPDYFKRLKKEGNEQKITEAKKALKQFFVTRTEKGFSDPRQTLSKNYGFLEGRPIQIDVGKIEPFSGDLKDEITKIHAHIDEWVSRM